MKIVAVIAEDSPVKTLIVAALCDLASIELQYYTPDSLNSVILDDRIGTAIYIAAKTDEEIKEIAAVRSAVSCLVLVSDKDIPAIEANLFALIEHFGSFLEAIEQVKEIRSLVGLTDFDAVLSRLTARQRKVLEVHCLFLPEKDAIDRAGVSRSTYQRTLKEVKAAFNVDDSYELRKLFCQSKPLPRNLYKSKPNEADRLIDFPSDVVYGYS
jgi:hypothetical protein